MGQRILLVDDDNYILMITRTMLSRSGYTVDTAPNGEEAIEIIKKKSDDIECVILDLSMPGLSGKETLRQIKSIDPNLQIIISSGYTKEEVLDKFEPGEIAGVLKKPYQLSGLLDSVKSVLV